MNSYSRQLLQAEVIVTERRKRLFKALEEVRAMGVRVLAPVHDEITLEVPPDVDEERVRNILLEALE